MQPKALLVQGINDDEFLRQHSFEELGQLAQTAGLEVVGRFEHSNRTENPQIYLGKGTLWRLEQVADQLKPDIVIIDDQLSPRQYRELTNLLQRGVLDRTELIIKIFSLHANSAAGQLQVKKALLEHMLPRLIGQGQHMSRLGGGIGTRGPGETQLETDRRRLRAQIRELDKELARLQRNRRQWRKRRLQSGLPLVALAGYTNAGKSTLHRQLTGSRVAVQDMLFTTLDPKTSAVILGGLRVLVTDTVGFISRLPTSLVEAFHSTLEVITDADCVLHVIDASSPYADWQREAGEQQLKELGIPKDKVLAVYNKLDLATAPFYTGGNGIMISAKTGEGLDKLIAYMKLMLTHCFVVSRLLVPYQFAQVTHDLYESGLVMSCEYGPDGAVIEAKLRRDELERLIASGQVQVL